MTKPPGRRNTSNVRRLAKRVIVASVLFDVLIGIAFVVSCKRNPPSTAAGPRPPTVATTNESKTPVASPKAPTFIPASGYYTHTITADTALLRWGSSGVVIYDTISAGQRVRADSVTTEYIRVLADDGRDGLVARERLRPITPPPVQETTRSSVAATPAPEVAPKRPQTVEPESAPSDVDAAVDKAVAYLISKQQKDGSWETETKANAGESRGSQTALVTYALLWSDASSTDPAMKKAIEWLEAEDLHGTYAVGMRAQVWNLIPDAQKTRIVVAARERDKEFVLVSRVADGPDKGYYDSFYGKNGGLTAGVRDIALDPAGAAAGDRANGQFGVFGAWAIEHAGAEIPTQYWLDEDAAWKKGQNPDGGWNSEGGRTGNPSTVSMTAAGLMTLFITQDYVSRSNSHQFDVCKGGVSNPSIEKGLAWYDNHAAEAFANPTILYEMERVAVASGRKYFGSLDWHKTGSEKLVKSQVKGAWGDIYDTCFGLLFLVQGRAPVVLNKLMYENVAGKQDNPWNERPRDAANLTRWMGHALCSTPLSWQLVDLKGPADDLHDAPVLYLSGSDELTFKDQDVEKLRQYVEEGGMILANADCGSKIFSSSFEALGRKMFPKYEFRMLPANHPVFREQFLAARWKSHPTVLGLSNGVRELMILIPDADPGHAWQNESTKTREERFQLAHNIILYASGREIFEHKGSTYIVHPGAPAKRAIKLARIAAGENWDPEPGAWRRMSAILNNDHQILITPETVKLGKGKLAGYKLAHLTGTTRLLLLPEWRKEIADFVENGGTLIVDAAGGSVDFADGAEDELRKIFGDAAIKGLAQPLPADHPAYRDFNKDDRGLYRIFARTVLTGSFKIPRVRGIATKDGRIGVFFSREDITAAMVGEPVDGIVGYEPRAAAEMIRRFVMYSLDAVHAP